MVRVGRAWVSWAVCAIGSCVPLAPVHTPAPEPVSTSPTGPPVQRAEASGPARSPVDLPRAAESPCPLAFADQNVILARVGDSTITACEIALADARDAREGLAARSPREVLVALVNEALLAMHAHELGLDQEAPTARRVRETLASAAVAQATLATAASSPLPDDEVARYYDAHRDEFTLPERVHLREIVCATPQDGARAIERLHDEPFETVLTETTSADGPRDAGDLGLVPRGGTDRVPEALADAGFALNAVGAVSETPIESVDTVRVGRHGSRRVSRWHVLQLLARVPGATYPLANVARMIRHRLRFGAYASARTTMRESLLERLRRENPPGAIAMGALQRIHIRAARR